jgi:hypothetical protein
MARYPACQSRAARSVTARLFAACGHCRRAARQCSGALTVSCRQEPAACASKMLAGLVEGQT